MDARVANLGRAAADDGWDGWAMSNLRPKRTGLPMVVWLQHGEGVRHDVRIKVSQHHGDRLSRDDLASVAVRPEPRLVEGDLDRRDLDLVARWIRLNEDAIVAHWNGETDTEELLAALRSIRA